MQTKLYLHPVSAYVKSMYIKSSAQSLVHARCSIDAYSIKMVTESHLRLSRRQKVRPKF